MISPGRRPERLDPLGDAGDRSLLDALPLPTVVFAADATIVRWNGAAERLFGWRADEVLGRPNPTVPPDGLEEALATHERIVAGSPVLDGLEVVRRARDGSSLEVRIFATPLPSTAGAPGSYVVVYEEIGARKRAERDLLEAQRQYRELVEALPLVTYVDEVAPGAPNLYTSPQMVELLGWTAAEWREDPRFFEKVLHPDDVDRVLALVELAARTHEPFDAEYRLRRRDGRYVWVRDRSTVVVDDDGTALSRGFLLDITDQKHLEQQLLQSQKMDALGQLAGGIAHDFNNLLTGIGGFADLAAASTRNPSVQRCLEGIRAAAAEASGLTARLLAFSRRDVLERRPVDVNAAVHGAAALLERVVREDVRLVLDLAPSLPPIAGDPGQIKQVVLNLALNARDAMPDGGTIRLATTRTAAGIRLAVADDGTGMDESTRTRALEPFFTTKEEGEGTGLGLSVVYGVVEGCGGTLEIRSQLGAGTTVTIELPAADGELADVQPAVTVPAGRGGGERVLVVEDREVVRDLARSVLEDAGYRVVAAPGGAEALTVAGGEVPFSLLLTDVVMPEMSGAELARRLRAEQPELRVLYMSGYTDDVLGREELEARHTAFLRKPFGTAELTAAVRDLLETG